MLICTNTPLFCGYRFDERLNIPSGNRYRVTPSLSTRPPMSLLRKIWVAVAAVGLVFATVAGCDGNTDPHILAEAQLQWRGWTQADDTCLNTLWERESSWNKSAVNPSSGAYGIPQALPAEKMASAGPDWRTSAPTQIAWGLQYLSDVYGNPCNGRAHENAYGWY